MKSKIYNLEDYKPHKVSEVICINCKYRFINVRPEKSLLRNLECPKCKNNGFIIETGQEFEWPKDNVELD